MSKTQSQARIRGCIAFCAAAALIVPWSLVRAGRVIEERRPADPQGEVEIITVLGKVEIDGWDRNEVEVSGTAGDDVERVDVLSEHGRTSIRVLGRHVHGWGSDEGPHLVIHVPAKSAVMGSLVSADVKVGGVLGTLSLQTVSGTVTGEARGDLRVGTVSGAVKLTATAAAKSIEVRTISGDIRLTGGGGRVDVTTVSGTAIVDLGEVIHGRFKTISGELSAALTLGPDAQIEGESVSGDMRLQFAGTPSAEFDVQAFSGDIKNCFGPKPVQSQYGQGSRLQFKNGEGHASVRVNSKSGDVQLCVKGMNGKRMSSLAVAQATNGLRPWPYIL
jgi:hypothetical protein